MELDERKKLRQNILKQLYDIHFEKDNGGIVFKDLREFQSQTNMEERSAYTYLVGKNLVDKIPPSGGNAIIYKISTRGIDYIESIL